MEPMLKVYEIWTPLEAAEIGQLICFILWKETLLMRSPAQRKHKRVIIRERFATKE